MSLNLSFIKTNIDKIKENNKILYYFGLYSALPTLDNKNTEMDNYYEVITPLSNQQYPYFIMSKFNDYIKIIILIDKDFEYNLEILKNRSEPDSYEENNNIIFYKYGNEYIFIIKHEIIFSDFIIIDKFIEYLISNTLIYNNKLIIQSYFYPLNLFVNFYKYLIKNESNNKEIFKNIIINFTPLREYTHSNCFCSSDFRYSIDNKLFDITSELNFFQYKLVSLNELLEYVKKNGIELNVLLYYYIIHIFESLQTLIKSNYNNINDCIINNDEYCLYLFIAYDIENYNVNKTLILDKIYNDIYNTLIYILSEEQIKEFILWKNESGSYYLSSNMIIKSFYDINDGIIYYQNLSYIDKLNLILNNLFEAIKINTIYNNQGLSNFKANLLAFFRDVINIKFH